MSDDRVHRLERLARALQIHLDLKASGQTSPADEVLEQHAEVRDLLEPMLRGESDAPPVDGCAPAEALDERSSDTLGDFQLVREVGRGGMGIVFEARRLSTGKRVALKVLAPGSNLDPRALVRFRREAELAARLDHDGVVQVHEAGSDRDIEYIAMDFVDGVALSRIVASAKTTGIDRLRETTIADLVRDSEIDTPVPEDRLSELVVPAWTKGYLESVVDIVAQVAEALQCAHDAGVVHRDVKPANILVRRDGRAVVTDFGIARDEGLPSVTVTGDFAGTPYYVSPEQAMAKRATVDHRTDVYSLGVTLYELTTLRYPFDGESTQEVFARIIGKEPRDPCRLNRRLPGDLGAVILRAIEKDPDRRYQSAQEFADDLRAFLAYQPVRARRNPWPLRLRRWVRREPLKTALVVTIAVALIVVAGLTGVFVSQVVAAERQASTEWKRAESALADFQLLATAVELDEARETVDGLVPPWPETVPAMRQWLTKHGRPLAQRLPGLRRQLERLRTEALEYTTTDALLDRKEHELYEQLQYVRGIDEAASREIQRLDRGEEVRGISRAQLERLRASVAQRVEELTPAVSERRTYRFADASRQFLFEQLAKLVGDLEEFAAETGPLSTLKRRLTWAESVAERTLARPAERWREAIAAIRESDGVTASALYFNLELSPQLGLVPLGMDPQSKLWEFAHLASGADGNETPKRDPGTGRLRITDDSGIVFVLVPGGRFTMGAQKKDRGGPNYDPVARPAEGPPHEVELGPFFLAKHELTQGQWSRLSGRSNPSLHNPSQTGPAQAERYGMNNPVERVNWDDAHDLMKAWGLRLPTEAQWEYACRAGGGDVWHTGSDKESLAGFTNISDLAAGRASTWAHERFLDDGRRAHAPVGWYLPNAFGLHDMHGNVAEWVEDGSGGYWQSLGPGDGLRPLGPTYVRGIRGGGYDWRALHVRTAYRYGEHRTATKPSIGFRAARTILTSER